MIIRLRFVVTLVIGFLLLSTVSAQEKARIFLGASSKTLGTARSGDRDGNF
jgi:hypothetical protein